MKYLMDRFNAAHILNPNITLISWILGQNKAVMKVNLSQKLSSQLTLTPQLKQAIRLLQMSVLEIEQELIQAADENPFLDFDNTPNEDYIDPILEFSHRSSSSKLQRMDSEDMEEFSTLSKEDTLLEFLMHQIATVRTNPDTQKILYFLAGCVDERAT